METQDRKGWISEKASELLLDRAETRQLVTAAKDVGRFTYRLEGRWFHEDDVTAAWKDAELDYEESFGLILCEGRR